MKYLKPMVVSVWVGQFPNEAALMAFVAERYGGGGAISQLAKAFDLGMYDEDGREASWEPGFEEEKEAALVGFSYSKSFSGALHSDLLKLGYAGLNAVIMLYDFEFVPSGTKEFERDGVRVVFVGSYAYSR